MKTFLSGCVTVLMFVALCAMSLQVNAEEVEVKGADIVKPGVPFEQLLANAMSYKVDKAELDAFEAELPTLEKWGKENPEKWNKTENAKDPIKTISSWDDLWSKTDLNAAQTIMVVMKLQASKLMANDQLDVAQIKQAKTMIEQVINNPNLPADQKTKLEENLKQINTLLDGIESYPESNTKFYEDNQQAIDSALARFQAIGQTAADEKAAKAPKSTQPGM